MKLKVILFSLSVFLIFSCSKKSNKNEETLPDSHELVDYLTPEENAFLESIGTPVATLEDVIGADGSPLARKSENNISYAKTKKDTIINSMIKKGMALCNQKTNKVYESDGKDYNPEHKGLVYSYGQRDYTKRLFPPPNTGANDRHRKYAVYGTDCSGLIINLLNHADINISSGASTKNFDTMLIKALENYGSKKMRLLIQDRMPEKELKTGDLILWRTKHIGIVYVRKEKVVDIIQSNGDPKPQTDVDQNRNLSSARGVRTISYQGALKVPTWGPNYTILRIVEAGDSIKGGLIFYLDKTGRHGLVSAPKDQANNVKIPLIYANSTRIDTGTGMANTLAMVAALGTGNNPASICDRLSLNDYDDWFLPSRDELRLIYSNLHVLKFGNFTSGEYCSSSDVDNTAVWCTSFVDGNSYRGLKYGAYDRYYNTYHVRAVRKF